MRTKSTGGFTLIELLIVIAIIGILAAVLIPNLLAARTRAFDTAAQSCARALATAQEVYAIDDADGAYATTYAQLNAGDTAGMVSACGDGESPIEVVAGGAWDDEDADPWTVEHDNGNNIYEVNAFGLAAQ